MKTLITSVLGICMLSGCAVNIDQKKELAMVKQPKYISDSKQTIWIPRQ
ncbi:hypothetical protein [Helicobacter sp. 12S02232-10]|nr:hypothetical protein [Helicobacter sp. 12S02232-10]